MLKTIDPKKFAADKIAMPALFIIALIIAALVVRAKSKITFSEPINLNHAGLSVAVPEGNGWQSEKNWRFSENTYSLRSFFFSSSSKPAGMTNCQYHLAAPAIATETYFQQQADSIDSRITKTGQIQKDSLIINWANIEDSQSHAFWVIAIAILPENRRLDIEVYSFGDAALSKNIFERIANSITLEDNLLLKAGRAIVTGIKENGVSHFLPNQKQTNIFVIKNLRNHPIGFTMDTFVDTAENAPANINVSSFIYISKRLEQNTSFKSDDKFENFTWKSEAADISGAIASKITFDNGLMTVRNLGPNPEEEKYQPGPSAIPDVFFDFVFIQMLEYDYSQFLVDIIDADGTIIPTLVSKIPSRSSAREDKSLYAIKIELLNRPNSSQKIYLNNKKQIVKRVLIQKGWTIEPASAEELLKLFPEHAGNILQKNKMLEQN